MKKYLFISPFLFFACMQSNTNKTAPTVKEHVEEFPDLKKYETFALTTDIQKLRESDREVLKDLIAAAQVMDELFWIQAYGHDKTLFLDSITESRLKDYARINYGPWDRLNNNEPFIAHVGPKPAGANFYPGDMTKSEFEDADLANKASLYTMIRRDSLGKLTTIPYHEYFKNGMKKASDLLLAAAAKTEDVQFKNYLEHRATALLSDEYQASDFAWLDMKDNTLDMVIGPIENYEDQLFGYKAAFEAYVLVKDQEWSKKLAHYAQFLPQLQKELPVADVYKKETPGSDVQLNAYDVIYYAGDCNAGSKTIAINLPNDEEVQLVKGTRRLQLKNAMKAKFDKILRPIAEVLIHPDQRKHINFDAFFSNTMFHEVAHGLGIKNTIDGRGTVREALKETYSAIEEGKADILGLYMIQQLHEKGELNQDLRDFQVTFMAGIFRSVRFGASSAHGKANMIRFNFFKERGAFEKDDQGFYRVNFDNFEKATQALSQEILQTQGDGDYARASEMLQKLATIDDVLQADLDRLNESGIPVDIVFEQGLHTLGL